MPIVYPKDIFAYNRVNKASCFVLMPFDPHFDEVYQVVRNALQSPELNLICRRADDFRAPNILETILKNIAQSEFIVADLTESNPNVFYELGIAHCVKNAEKVVILTQSIEFVPFDLRHLRCVIYEQSPSGLVSLNTELLKTFQDVSKNAFRFRVHEGKRFKFAKKLVGENNNFFDITFDCPHVGRDAVKLLIDFTQHTIDKNAEGVETQFLFLSEDFPTRSVNYIPWDLHLVQSSEEEALLLLEKR